jgi:hypothetical protein
MSRISRFSSSLAVVASLVLVFVVQAALLFGADPWVTG